MSRVPTIPDFAPVLEQHDATLRTIKQAIEILGGLRQGESVGAPLMFVQGYAPSQVATSIYRIGDLWIDTTTDTMKYWDGSIWKPLQ